METPTWMTKQHLKVATHGCPHHLDELVALALLRRFLDEDGRSMETTFLSRAEIDEGLDSYDVVIDIGREYDPSRGRFDHHQTDPRVDGRSAAGLLFDWLYEGHPNHDYLEPIIRQVDAIDTAGPERAGDAGDFDAASERARGMLSISYLLKTVGGFRHDPSASRQCLAMIESLVGGWFKQADGLRDAADVVAQAEPVAGGIFLPSSDGYGPGLLEYVRNETSFRFIGFPTEEAFKVIAVRDASGNNRINFLPPIEGAAFVHPKGFLAVWSDADSARRGLERYCTCDMVDRDD